MSDDVPAGDEELSGIAGSSADQHITGSEETGSFTTDEAPTSDTPAYGSSNIGINANEANRPPAD